MFIVLTAICAKRLQFGHCDQFKCMFPERDREKEEQYKWFGAIDMLRLNRYS